MADDLRFDGKVVIITGAGNGLGRSHALLFGSRGAKVVVNDLGGGRHGEGQSSAAADAVVKEIKDGGGEAVANYDSVEDGAKIVQCALDSFGRVDVVVNNAGILRDTSFAKMTEQDWELIYRVHVLGAFRVTHAAWPHMREQEYGRIIMTASAAGIYGNFGQANYALAKLGLVGFAQTLALEGKKKNVQVNTIAPIAGSRLTETVLPQELIDALKPEYVSPLVAWLAHEKCQENGGLFEVGGGFVGKLRWERAEGKTWRVGRPISIEDVKGAWPTITSFEKSTHPTDITSSMQPIMANIQKGPGQGGNELIDADEALGWEFPELETKYDERDLALYALGVGAAKNPENETDLGLVFEMWGGGFNALPTYGVVPAVNAILTAAKEGKQAPGLNYGLDRILHGEQYTEVKRPLPRAAELVHKSKVKDIFDKGRHALVVTETRSFDKNTGEELVYNEMTTFVRGAGGWGGDRGPSADINTPPDRKPDAVIEEKTDDNQALLYRLSGDWNPLHADPTFAKAFGFEKPILHGLCTFGYVGRHVINAFCKGDPRYFKSIKVRFADSVFPGETLVTEMWKESDNKIVFRTTAKERKKVVISNAAVELYSEIPKPAPPKKKEAAAAGGAPASSEPISQDVFVGIGKYLEANPDLAKKIGTVYQFSLKGPDSDWTVDLKNGSGSVAAGAPAKADCTLELTDADFMDMCTGKADPQKLYFGGKLKISGNVMASQKLEFLQKIDPNLVMDAAKARAGSGGGGGGAPAAASGPQSGPVFLAIGEHIKKNPDLAKKIGSVYVFQVTNPDSSWTLDLKNGGGSVSEGAVDKADCTLSLEESDFMDMVGGKADPQKLYFSGKLKVSGNVMASQKLEFLTKLDPKEVQAAIANAKSAPAVAAPKAASSAKKREPIARKVVAKLTERLKSNAKLAADVQAIIQFNVTEPDQTFTVDLKSGPGKVSEGPAKSADMTLIVQDSVLEQIVTGGDSTQALYQKGELRIDGDVRVAHRLGFLKQLV